MKKGIIISLIIVTALFAAHFYQNRKVVEIFPQNAVVNNNPNTEEQTQKEEQEFEVENYVENVDLLKYKISKPSVAVYKVNKKFLTKDAEEVLGETESLQGIADFDLEKNTLSLFAEVDLTDLRSDDASRDEAVIKLFSPQTAKVTYDGEIEQEIFLGEEGTGNINLTLEINGIKKDVPFDVSYFVEPSNANVKGMATVLMSDFEVEPPSLLSVYTVDDEMELYFDINFKKAL